MPRNNEFSERIDAIISTLRRGITRFECTFQSVKVFHSGSGALEFYRLAEERNNAIFNNTLKRMRQKGEKVAALVEKFPVAKTLPFFDVPEKKAEGSGGLLSITINPR